jgi:hypothetical protein
LQKNGARIWFYVSSKQKAVNRKQNSIIKSIVSPHIEYCSSLLYLINNEQMLRLQKIQNKIMRLILHSNKRTSISWMLETLKWQSVKQRIEFNTMILIYKIVNNLTPKTFSNNITYIRETHQHHTRSTNNIRLPNMTMAISQNSIFYKGLQAYTISAWK